MQWFYTWILTIFSDFHLFSSIPNEIIFVQILGNVIIDIIARIQQGPN